MTHIDSAGRRLSVFAPSGRIASGFQADPHILVALQIYLLYDPLFVLSGCSLPGLDRLCRRLSRHARHVQAPRVHGREHGYTATDHLCSRLLVLARNPPIVIAAPCSPWLVLATVCSSTMLIRQTASAVPGSESQDQIPESLAQPL